MNFKKMMAFEIVKIIRGEEEAIKAQRYFEATVQNKEMPEEISEIKIKAGNYKLVDLLVEAGMAISKSEAGRLIEQGGVKVDEEKINNIEAEIFISEKEILIQKGKRGFVKIIKK